MCKNFLGKISSAFDLNNCEHFKDDPHNYLRASTSTVFILYSKYAFLSNNHPIISKQKTKFVKPNSCPIKSKKC